MLDRTVAPSAQEISSLEIPSLPLHPLTNGLPLYYISDPKLKVVKVELHFPAGKWWETVRGSASFLSKLLTEGTANRSSAEINQKLESLGAFIECHSGQDQLIITVYSLIENLDPVLDVIHEIITNGKIANDELEKLRDTKISQHRINLEKTNYLASRIFRKILFGSDHPYGSLVGEEEILGIKAADLTDLYMAGIRHRPFTLIASGRVDESVISTLDKYFGKIDLLGSRKSPSYSYKSGKKVTVDDKEGAVQSTIYLGKMMPGRSKALTHEIAIVNQVLGGYFGARLMKNLREEKGYTYGIYSRISHLQQASFLSISADVIKDSREQSIEEVRREMKILNEERVGEEELELVKSYMLGSLLSSVDSVFSIASLFKLVHFSGLGLDFYQSRIQAIKSISSDEVIELSREYFNPDDLFEVTVG